MKNSLMKTSLGMLMLGSLGLATTGAQADWQSDGHAYRQAGHDSHQSQRYGQQINVRQERQMDRIRAGMHDGSLTRPEFRDLMHEQRKIQTMEHHFQADGVIDAREFQRLNHALDRADRDIRTERHDRQAPSPHRTRFN